VFNLEIIRQTTPLIFEYNLRGKEALSRSEAEPEGKSTDLKPEDENDIRWIYELGNFTPLARYDKGQLHYTITDTVGRIQELLTENGMIVWRGEQQLWGRETGFQREGAPGWRLRFAGQYEDEKSGLYYNRHRYYDCGTGHYLSADPVGLAGGAEPVRVCAESAEIY